MAPASSGGKKRISFLMPFIDFCFLLIILFVALLSVAYFDPSPVQSLQTKQGGEQSQGGVPEEGTGNIPLTQEKGQGDKEQGIFDPKANEKAIKDLQSKVVALKDKLEEALADGQKAQENYSKVVSELGTRKIATSKTRQESQRSAPKTSNADSAKLRKVLADFQKVLQENMVLQQQVSQLTQEVEKLKQRIAALEKEKEKLKRELEKAKERNALFLDSGSSD